MGKSFFGHRNGSPDAEDVLTPARVAEIGGSIPLSQVQEFRRIPNSLPSVFPPAVVTGLSVATSLSGQLVISWSAPSDNGGSAVTGYILTGTNGTNNNAATSPVTITGLEDNVPYTFSVAAVNEVGTGLSSNVVGTSINSPPAAPTNVVATAGDATATVTWTAPANTGGSAIQSYTVNCSDGQSQTVEGTTATFGVTNGVAITFTVSATNTASSGPFSAASSPVTPSAGTPPGAPTSLAGAAGNAQVALSWTAPSSSGTSAITGYVVEWTPSGSSASTVSTGSSGTSYTKTSLTNGTAHTFRVAAVSAVGQGPYSSAVSVTPVAASGVVFSSVTPDSLNMYSTSSAQNVSPTWSVSGSGTSTLTFSKSYSGLYNQHQNAPFELAFTISGANDCELDLTNIQWASGINGGLNAPNEPRIESVGGGIQNEFTLSKNGQYVISIPVGNSTIPSYSRMRLAAGSYKLVLNGSKQFPQTSVSWAGTITVKERSTTPAKFFNSTPSGFSAWQGGVTNKAVTESMAFGFGGSRNLYWSQLGSAITIRIQSVFPAGAFTNTVRFGIPYSAAVEAQGWTYNDKDAYFYKEIANTNGGYVDVALPSNASNLIITQANNTSTTQLYATIIS